MNTPPPLIPRKLLFDNPERTQARLSPDGAYLSWLAPKDGVLNVWVAPRENLTSARPITNDTGRGIRLHHWAFTNQHILYIQDKNGDENWHLYAVNITTQTEIDLTPFEGVAAQLNSLSHKHPAEALVALNNRNPQWHDLYRIHLLTGERTLLLEHDRFAGVEVDDDFTLRFGLQMMPDGSQDIYQYTGNDWQRWDTIPQADMLTCNLMGFDKANRTIFMQDSRARNTAALFAIDPLTKTRTLLAEDARADLGDVLRHPTEKHVQAVSFTYDRKQWQVLDPAVQTDLDFLATVADGDINIVSRTLDDRFWVIAYSMDISPTRYYLYDRPARQAQFLFTDRPALEKYPLEKMHAVVIPARDGLELVSYYTLPPGTDSNSDGLPDHPVPMVLFPHGGPWGRDFWGYHPYHQWLANRGYAVLSVNFRSSTGFGKAFTNAGDFQWGEKIMQDQIDAVQWAIKQGIADPRAVAVMGGSFGGYSTLAGLTMFPETFACGVDIVGPSNLITLLESIPPYWKPVLELFTSRVGDFRTEEGRALLTKHSPLTYVDNIRSPLLIAQGANDPRVKQAESDQIVQAMQAKNIPVTYVLYPDEGHGFARPENNLSFAAVAEAFLATRLEGRFEPIGTDFKGASLQVPEGATLIPGLAEALAEMDGTVKR
ncbi:MAG: S9 family peptidase [Anaerolineales bacterium]